MTKSLLKVGITQGDINGISYEIIIKTLMDNRMLEECIPIVYGSPKVLAYHRKALNINNFSMNAITEAKEANPRRVNMINLLDDDIRVELGKATSIAGEAAFLSLERAASDLYEHQIDVLVTSPINKHTIQSKSFHFPGHTEFLREKFSASEVLMLMLSPGLNVGVVTGHIPMAEVPSALSEELILKKIQLMEVALREDLGIRRPRIAVLGLNPHAGDHGLLGKEEETMIKPAIEKARAEDIMAVGPFAADGLFGAGVFGKFDGVLAMYHDQGLSPFKAIGFYQGVNYTAGLPIVRTSPAHGIAYEIAGQGIANPESFREAIFKGIDIYRARRANYELKKGAMQPSE